MIRILYSIPLCLLAAMASVDGFALGGPVFQVPSPAVEPRDARWLVYDGSFELGTCQIAPTWLCESSNDCDWIVNLVPLGLWNYHGNHVAWLGGFCDGEATEYTQICQEVELHYDCAWIHWAWMADINQGGSKITVTLDGGLIFEKILAPFDHHDDYLIEGALAIEYEGQSVELCFRYDRNGAYGDSYFFDYVEGGESPTPAKQTSLSTVKSMY